MAGIGRFLALTQNDAVNAMAVAEFSHFFGSQNVYRLPPSDSDKGSRAKVGVVSKGRLLFAENWNETKFEEVYNRGFRPKLTRITTEFTFEDFKAKHGEEVIVILVIDKNAMVQINTTDIDLKPSAEQSVIAMVKTEPTVGKSD